jgi:hypothetical protein
LGHDERGPVSADIQPVKRVGRASGSHGKVSPVNDIHIIRATKRDLIKVPQSEGARLVLALFGLTATASTEREGHGQ